MGKVGRPGRPPKEGKRTTLTLGRGADKLLEKMGEDLDLGPTLLVELSIRHFYNTAYKSICLKEERNE
jgi:hypothetical protein